MFTGRPTRWTYRVGRARPFSRGLDRPPGTLTEGNVGLECLSPETNIWDLDLSTRTDDEPLMEEIVVAHNVQRRFFPRHKPPLQTLDYSGKCVQARTVGRDYYDFLDLGSGHVG